MGLMIKAGFNFRVSRNNIVIIELSKHVIPYSNPDLYLEPISIKLGLSFLLEKPKEVYFQNPRSTVSSDRLIMKKVKKRK